MRILEVVHYFYPHVGGVEKFVKNLSKDLISLGHQVTVLTTWLPGTKSDEQLNGIQIKRYRPWCTVFRNPITLGMLYPRVDVQNYDLIHAHVYYSFAAIAAGWIKRAYKKPLVITCHGNLISGNKLVDYIEPIYTNSVGKLLLSQADCITVMSESEKNRLIEMGIDNNKLFYLPNVIDLEQWDRYKEICGLPFEQKFLEENKIILFVGSIIERKGVDYLIKALPLIYKRIPNAFCVFVGDGYFMNQAKHLINELNIGKRVFFAGQLESQRLAEYYRIADVYVLPSLAEGLPTTMLEAATFSKPLVSTDIDGVRDHFSDVAILVEPRNVQALANAIINVLENQELTYKLGKAARELVENKLNRKTQLECIKNILDVIVP